eukprot:COSAG02_NODE_64189_length_261_cov_0.641975_1_plen_31_part_10
MQRVREIIAGVRSSTPECDDVGPELALPLKP